MKRVVVVGAGLGGVRAAQGLRRAGFEGEVVLVGEEQHAPYDRPPLSKGLLTDQRTPESLALASPDELSAIDVELALGVAATGLDLGERLVRLGEDSIRFDGLVLATGSTARTLPDLDGLENVFTLRTIDDGLGIRDAFERAGSVAIVGAGFIGSEVASTARSRGLAVTVLELETAPLARALGHALGSALARLHEENGTDLRLGVTVTRVESSEGRVTRLHVSDGSSLEPDIVVVGIGASPATGWLESSGLGLAGGVICGADLSVGAPSVFAIGDIASWPNDLFGRRMRVEHWTNAVDHARHVARSLAEGTTSPFVSPNYVWSDQYDARIQLVGIPSTQHEVVDGSLDGPRFLAWFRESGRLVGALAINSPKPLMKSRTMIEQRLDWDDALAALSA